MREKDRVNNMLAATFFPVSEPMNSKSSQSELKAINWPAQIQALLKAKKSQGIPDLRQGSKKLAMSDVLEISGEPA